MTKRRPKRTPPRNDKTSVVRDNNKGRDKGSGKKQPRIKRQRPR